MLADENWLAFSQRRAALATMIDHAKKCRAVDGMTAKLWMLAVISFGDDVPPNPNADEMSVIPSIAAGWVWGYHRS
jgi:hypothetical protein